MKSLMCSESFSDFLPHSEINTFLSFHLYLAPLLRLLFSLSICQPLWTSRIFLNTQHLKAQGLCPNYFFSLKGTSCKPRAQLFILVFSLPHTEYRNHSRWLCHVICFCNFICGLNFFDLIMPCLFSKDWKCICGKNLSGLVQEIQQDTEHRVTSEAPSRAIVRPCSVP